jgi:hypothetical protein
MMSLKPWIKICSIAKLVEEESFANFTIAEFFARRDVHFCRTSWG